jgi:hypothetical protein
MTQRNQRRKRTLQRKLDAIQRHITSLTGETAIPPPSGGEGGGEVSSTAEQEHSEEVPEEGEGLPLRRTSPSHSTGSSVELVEAPSPENERESSAAAGAAGASTSGASSDKKSETTGGYSLVSDSWKRYASLGSSRKKDA